MKLLNTRRNENKKKPTWASISGGKPWGSVYTSQIANHEHFYFHLFCITNIYEEDRQMFFRLQCSSSLPLVWGQCQGTVVLQHIQDGNSDHNLQ
jgi:hypothetical protein